MNYWKELLPGPLAFVPHVAHTVASRPMRAHHGLLCSRHSVKPHQWFLELHTAPTTDAGAHHELGCVPMVLFMCVSPNP